MNENELLARTVCAQMEQNLPVALVSLLSLKGSTPRHEGTKMLIAADGKPYGTIGGSLMEASAIDKARAALEKGSPEVFTFELNEANAGASGMICGGTAEVLVDYLEPSPANRELAAGWLNAVSGGEDCFLITCFSGIAGNIHVGGRALMLHHGGLLGALPLTEENINGIRNELRTITTSAVMPFGDWNVLVDPMRKLKTLYLFGAGHVAVPTAHIAAMVGFRVVAIDDRPEYASVERFPDARGVIVTGDFAHAVEDVPINEDSYIVIITRGHQYDREVLQQALKTKAGYIGMISSRRKRETIYAALRKTGVEQSALDAVHSPIGLNIGGETPEEIAVSIVAELISVRSGNSL